MTVEKIGVETPTYVRNIYKYYAAYETAGRCPGTAKEGAEQLTPANSNFTTHGPYEIRIIALLFLALMSDAGVAADGTLSGTATYRERIALPPDAVFEATLEDVSKADARAVVIGRVRIEAPGNPPIHSRSPTILRALRAITRTRCAAVSCAESS